MRPNGRLFGRFAWNGQGDCLHHDFSCRGVSFEAGLALDGVPFAPDVGNYLYFLSHNVVHHRYVRFCDDTNFTKKAFKEGKKITNIIIYRRFYEENHYTFDGFGNGHEFE